MSDLIARHGETEYGLKGLFAGPGVDNPLTPLGVMQAEHLAETLATSPVVVDRIVSSPTPRAYDTASIVARRLGTGLTIIQEPGITEYDMGELTGTPFRIKNQGSGLEDGGFRNLSADEVLATKGVEDPELFRNRVVDGIRRWSDPEKQTLFVAHGGVMQVIDTMRHGLPAREFRDLPKPEPASVRDITFLALMFKPM